MIFYRRKYFGRRMKKTAREVLKIEQVLGINFFWGLSMITLIFYDLLAFFINLSWPKDWNFKYGNFADTVVALIFILMGIKIYKGVYRYGAYLFIVGLGIYIFFDGPNGQAYLLKNIALTILTACCLHRLCGGKIIWLTITSMFALRLYYMTGVPLLMELFLVIIGMLIARMARHIYSPGRNFLGLGFARLGGIVLLVSFFSVSFPLSIVGISFLGVSLWQNWKIKSGQLTNVLHNFGSSAFYYYFVHILLLKILPYFWVRPKLTLIPGICLALGLVIVIYFSGRIKIYSLTLLRHLFDNKRKTLSACPNAKV